MTLTLQQIASDQAPMSSAPEVDRAPRPVKFIRHRSQVARRRRSAHVRQHRGVRAPEAVLDNLPLDLVPLHDVPVILQMQVFKVMVPIGNEAEFVRGAGVEPVPLSGVGEAGDRAWSAMSEIGSLSACCADRAHSDGGCAGRRNCNLPRASL